MEDIEEILKKIGKIVLRFTKMLLAKVGIYILIPIVICLIIVLAWFETSGITAKSSSESAKTISSATSIIDGEIIISDDIYDRIREDLKDKNINPESYFLGKNDKCQDGSGLTYLEKMVQAEVVSNYINTGKGEIRGIVKIQRNGVALEYISLEDLNNRIAKANEKQEEGKVEDALKYFSVDENWNLVVAKSNKCTSIDISGDEMVVYEVTSEVINYQEMVSQYTMPYEFLFILMEVTNNPEYVSAVADLVLKNSEIVLDIKDSTTIETTTVTTKWEDETVVRKSARYDSEEEAKEAILTGNGTKTKESKQQSSSKVNEVTTLTVKVTKADTWIYNKEISYIAQTVAEEPIREETKMEDELGTEKSEIKLSISGTMEEADTQYYKEGTALNIINKTMTYTTNTSTTNWVADASSSEQIKTDDFLGLWRNKQGKYTYSDSEEYVDGINKFVTEDDGGLKVKYKLPDNTYHIAVNNILNEYDSADIFLNLLSKCERTQNIETIMRYVLYIYTGKDYGVTDVSELLDFYEDISFSKIKSSGNELYDYMRIWENVQLYRYYIKETTVCDKYAEGDYYKVYYGGSEDPTYNLAYGIVISRDYNDSYFEEMGVDKEELRGYQTDGETFEKLNSNGVEKIFEKIVDKHKESVLNTIENISLEENQINALVAIHYQYGNIGNFVGAYNSYYKAGKITEFQENFKDSQGYQPLLVSSSNNKEGRVSERVKANWNLFSTSIYSGKGYTLDTSKVEVFGDYSEMVNFALSYIGKNGEQMAPIVGYEGEWCAAFVSYCYKKSGLIPSKLSKAYINCNDIVAAGKAKGCYKTRESGYIPKTGDLILYDWEPQNGLANHVGIVVNCDSKKVYTVEGNIGNGKSWKTREVGTKERKLTYTEILGYYSLSE